METKIVLSLLKSIGIHSPTSDDYQRVCKILRIELWPKKIKLALWLGLPMVLQYLEYVLDPEKQVEE